MEASSAPGRVGFIGLGIMGTGMANSLLKAGVKLAVWNRTARKANQLKEQYGTEAVTTCESPAQVLAAANLVYVMLSTPDVVNKVYNDQNGILSAVASRTKIVDCATLAAEDMLHLEAQVIQRGGRFLSAPVSGSKVQAETGQLIFLAGGDEQLFHEIEADLSVMGKAKFFFGTPKEAANVKLVVNMIMGNMMCALGEGLSLCGSAKIDTSTLLQVLELGAMCNPLFKVKGPRMLSQDHSAQFPLKHAEKDMRLATQLGESLGVNLPVSGAARESMKQACEAGHADLDMSAVYEIQRACDK